MNKLAALPCPTVSMVHGICLGGGTELSLACKYIVASDDKATRIGLPEIKLGIHPGYGGTARSIERCGPLAAMDIMLTGRALPSRTAKKIGLIDEMVPLRQLKHAARHYAMTAPKRKGPGFVNRLLNHSLLRPVIASQMRKQVSRKAKKEHYPAPYSLIDLWQKHAGNSKRMLEEEAKAVAGLATTETARNLVRVFFLQEEMKNKGKQTNKPPINPNTYTLLVAELWAAISLHGALSRDTMLACRIRTPSDLLPPINEHRHPLKRNTNAIAEPSLPPAIV